MCLWLLYQQNVVRGAITLQLLTYVTKHGRDVNQIVETEAILSKVEFSTPRLSDHFWVFLS